MKRTHKLKAMRSEVTEVLNRSRSVTEAAKRLGIARETLARWISAGKVPRPSWKVEGPSDVTVDEDLPPEEWAAKVRAEFELDVTEAQLLTLATEALKIARQPGQDPTVRLSAMNRFAALVKQLKLEPAEEENDGKAKKGGPGTVAGWPRAV